MLKDGAEGSAPSQWHAKQRYAGRSLAHETAAHRGERFELKAKKKGRKHVIMCGRNKI